MQDVREHARKRAVVICQLGILESILGTLLNGRVVPQLACVRAHTYVILDMCRQTGKMRGNMHASKLWYHAGAIVKR